MERNELLQLILEESNQICLARVCKYINMLVYDIYNQMESAQADELVSLQAKLQAYKTLLKRFNFTIEKI